MCNGEKKSGQRTTKLPVDRIPHFSRAARHAGPYLNSTPGIKLKTAMSMHDFVQLHAVSVILRFVTRADHPNDDHNELCARISTKIVGDGALKLVSSCQQGRRCERGEAAETVRPAFAERPRRKARPSPPFPA
jgi:hypothetical protein